MHCSPGTSKTPRGKGLKRPLTPSFKLLKHGILPNPIKAIIRSSFESKYSWGQSTCEPVLRWFASHVSLWYTGSYCSSWSSLSWVWAKIWKHLVYDWQMSTIQLLDCALYMSSWISFSLARWQLSCRDYFSAPFCLTQGSYQNGEWSANFKRINVGSKSKAGGLMEYLWQYCHNGITILDHRHIRPAHRGG